MHARVTCGIARTFQNIRLFGQLTVWQNLWVAQNSGEQRSQNFARRWFGGSSGVREEIERTLEFFDLAHKSDELAANLAFGEQRRLEFARALAAKPTLLLLDEPAAGMNAEEIDQLDDRIRKMRQDGITVLLIEHHMELVMSVADRIAVLNFGQKIAEGTPAAVQANPRCARPISAPPRSGEDLNARHSRHRHCLWQDRSAEGRLAACREAARSPACSAPTARARPRLMMTIAGILQPRRGSIRLDGTELAGLSPARIVSRGVALVPENRLVFPQMSVHENLLAGAYQRSDRAGINADIERMYGRFPRLKERCEQMAGTLSGGEQQMLAVARALMSRPRVLLMDEPSLGLGPLIVAEIFKIIAELNRDGTTIFLVEQNAHMALQVAHQFFLMERGRITFQGTPGQLAEDEVIQRAYLGTRRAAG